MIRIGTRGSKLALIQANLLKDKLIKLFSFKDEQIKIIPIKTTGDKIQNKNLYEIGGKGLFIKELEESLLKNEIDLAVHSLKDIPAIIPAELKIAAVIERGNPYDAFLSPNIKDFLALPQGAVLGTSSPRRSAQILNLRPDIKIISFRGNVETRLAKLANKIADATILSVAGLERLAIEPQYYTVIDSNKILPAIGQGAICAECRKNDQKIIEMLSLINDKTAFNLSLCERIFLEGLNANCKTPVGGLAYLENGKIHFKAMVAKFDGSVVIRAEATGDLMEYEQIGSEVLSQVKNEIGEDFFGD